MPTMLIYAKIAAEYSISEDRVRQIIRNGQVLILRNGVAYDMMGQTL